MAPIRKLLVANRGAIARRVIRTCRGMGIATVAVFSEADREAPFVGEADEAVALGGSTPAESYLRVEAVLDAARRAGADAVHPGYGFLAESAAFARACAAAGVVFVGPPPEAIEAMGVKGAARERMRAAGLPVLPGAELAGGTDPEAAADAVGWPLLVKASAGGGGKGMRLVREPRELAAALASARREAAAAFGDGTLLVERWLEACRHVEVQVVGDAHGHLVSLFERECSIQRRHQKIVEECPSPAVDPVLRGALEGAAVAAARACGYRSAGTVEFLLAPDGSFYFLEMNTRLQVEHAVTECVTGLDLVRLQILVAQGEALPAEALEPARSGHAIEARICAEDPERGFLPTAGTLHRFRFGAGPGLRVEAGVADGSAVGVHYDPLLAKAIAHAPTRAEAAARLSAALAGMQIHGVTTNRDLLVRILRDPAFLAGETDTRFLERRGAGLAAPLADAAAERLHASAAALAAAAERRRRAAVLGFAPPGWRNNPSRLQEAAFEGRHGRIAVGYAFRRGGLALHVDGARWDGVRLGTWSPERVELEAGGVRRRCEVHRVGELAYVDSPLGSSALREIAPCPAAAPAEAAGTLTSPMPGVVLRLGARPGQEVEAGAVVAVLEAMKMEHAVTAPHAGRVAEVRVREGQTVDAGVVLAVIEKREAS